MPLTINIWRYSSYLGITPPTTDPDVVGVANLTVGQREVGGLLNCAYLLTLIDLDIRSSEVGIFSAIPQVDRDLVECPAGSSRYYSVVYPPMPSGLGFPNAHLITQIIPGYLLPPSLSRLAVELTPDGLVDGTNQNFTLPFAPNFVSLSLNGLTLNQGIGEDYVISGSTITMAIPPQVDDEIVALVE